MVARLLVSFVEMSLIAGLLFGVLGIVRWLFGA